MRRGRSRQPGWLPILLFVSLLLGLAVSAAAWEGGHGWRHLLDEEGEEEDVSGPIVRDSEPAPAEGPMSEIVLKANATEKKTIAQIIDEALEQEFPEEKQEGIGKNYNETAKNADATVETVIKVSGSKKHEDGEDDREIAGPNSNSGNASGSGDAGNVAGAGGSASSAESQNPNTNTGKPKEHKHHDHSAEAEVDRIIDAQDNEYILSKPKDGTVGLTLDPQLIRDLTVLITSSTGMGMVLETLRQPVINGYLIAGSIVGPGGLQMIKELVQVESLAQVGVQLLLFTLGLEFSLSKLRAVRSVALVGGVMQILLTMVLAGGLASAIGASIHEGVFIGALVSMSSTSIVIKCLADARQNNSPHGQITIGTLILQDCMVGLLFAFMPVLAHKPGGSEDSSAMVARLLFRVVVSLAAMIAAAVALTRTVLPAGARLLAKHATDELYQLTIIAFCLVGSFVSGYLGLSTELGAFVAGVMLSATDQQEHALHQLEQVKGFFMSLFIASTGLVMSPRFLAAHLPVLAAGVFLVVLGKGVLISGVVMLFRYPPRTALAVGLGMAQIGEFAFVLLSSASQHGLLPYQVYMLLMGVTGLSLLVTPFLMQLSTRYLQLDGDPGLFKTVRQAGHGAGRHGPGGGAPESEMLPLSQGGLSDDTVPPPSPTNGGRHRPMQKGKPFL
mmetsp:Transcript_4045/g.11724  ORF Transcript_4045/g.11724 Transcript_4045/m.11724 type:complete len:673 (-) Transcript_4045:1075-3093(-)